MGTLTYVKGLPTPIDELNAIGMSTFEMFLNEYSQVTFKASCQTVNHLLTVKRFHKSSWNTYLQKTYGINKRHANGIIAYSEGRVKAAIEHRKLHLKNLKRKLKSIKSWLSTANKKLKSCRMLSAWAYSKFYDLLNSICTNRGIQLKTVNPAYTSLIGLTKYVRMYGVSSGVAAAIAIARRGMRLSEKLPCSITAYLEVNSGKHVWSNWNKLNKQLKTCTEIRNRHSYYGISNWDFLVKG